MPSSTCTLTTLPTAWETYTRVTTTEEGTHLWLSSTTSTFGVPIPSSISLYYSQSTGVCFCTYSQLDEVVPYRPKPTPFYIIKRRENKARKALWRGVKLFSSLFGETKIKAFLSGNSFIVEGKLYDYCIKPKHNLIHHTQRPTSYHIPYHLEILTKGGLVLAQCCTVFNNTPVIDQLIAFMMHVQDNEEYLLQHMNFSRRSIEFRREDFLMDLCK